jgi:hypothetical protein
MQAKPFPHFRCEQNAASTLEFQSIDENMHRMARASMGSGWERHLIYWQTPGRHRRHDPQLTGAGE